MLWFAKHRVIPFLYGDIIDLQRTREILKKNKKIKIFTILNISYKTCLENYEIIQVENVYTDSSVW